MTTLIHYVINHLGYLTRMQGWGYGAFLLFSFCLQSVGTLGSVPVEHPPVYATAHVLAAHGYSASHNSYCPTSVPSYRSPLKPIVINSSEPENKNEEENLDYGEWMPASLPLYDHYDFIPVSFHVFFSQIERHIQGRSSIPLVILHHAWKHFLS